MSLCARIQTTAWDELEEALEALRQALVATRMNYPTDELWSVRRAAKVAGVPPRTVRDWVNEGHLTACGDGREPRVRRSELETFLSSRMSIQVSEDDPEQVAREVLARIGVEEEQPEEGDWR